MEYLNKLKEFWNQNNGKIPGMKFKKFLKENSEIESALNEILNKNPHLNNVFIVAAFLVNNLSFDYCKCKICGKILKVKSFSLINDIKYCSTKCAMNDPELQKKKSETIAKDPNYWKNRQEKITKTNLKRYGTKTPAENKDVVQKMKDTISKDQNHWKKRQEKSEKTCMEKYGVKNTYNIKEIKDKSIKTRREKLFNSFKKFKNEWKPLFTLDEFKNTDIKTTPLKYYCEKCKKEFLFCFGNEKILINTLIPKNIPKCSYCYDNLKHGQSKNERDIFNFIKENYDGIIYENTKKFTNPYELDIVIPDKKLAIEYNGNYWHSLQVRNNQFYHINKSKLCEKNGLSLFHIFEFDWINEIKQKIIKRMILERLDIFKYINYNNLKILYDIPKEKCSEFIKLNSLHEFNEFDKSIGLFEDRNLISLICLSEENEIVNYATSIPINDDFKILIDSIKIEKLKIKTNYAYDNIKKIKDAGFILIKEETPNLINFYHKNDKQYQLYDCGNLVFERNLNEK